MPRDKRRRDAIRELIRQSVDLGAYELRSLALLDVVKELTTILGRHNVAAIAGVNRTSTLANWIAGGDITIKPDVEARLRLSLRLIRIIESRFSTSTASAWLQGSNSGLDDEMPIALVATAPLEKFEKALITAAHAFVQI